MKSYNKTKIILILLIIALFIPGIWIVGVSAGKGKLNVVYSDSKKAGNPPSDSQEDKIAEKSSSKPMAEEKEYKINLLYDRYPLGDFYILIKPGGARIYARDSRDSETIGWARHNTKITCVYGANGWYYVNGEYLGRVYHGFIPASMAEFRRFRVDEAYKKVKKLREIDDKHEIFVVDNYHNRKGKPPQYKGRDEDAFRGERSGSAPAYFKAEALEGDSKSAEEFFYIPDGTMVIRQETFPNYSKIKIVHDGREGYINNSYINSYGEFRDLSLIVVVDTVNQNQITFRRMVDGKWEVLSKTLCTTGKEGYYSSPTFPGDYGVMERRIKLYYLRDGTSEIEGYAPYTLRFNGGAYIHGVPIGYVYPRVADPKNPDRLIADKSRPMDPGMREFMSEMGTIPLSHKCVRNFTSHAKFLYDIFQPGKSAVIVM